jgi:predicted site-specific integrase-resolvase
VTETATEDWLSPAQAGQRLGVSAERVRQLERAGLLTCRRTALGRLIDPAGVERLANERSGTAQPAERAPA